MLAATLVPALRAQPAGDVAELRGRLLERYDIVALQNGIGLVPRQPDARIAIIQIRDGAVAINGQELTGRELRERLGSDADLVLRITYLEDAVQQQLAAGSPVPPPPAAAGAAPEQPDTSVPRRVRRQGELVRVGGDARVERDERVEDNVVVVMGSARDRRRG